MQNTLGTSKDCACKLLEAHPELHARINFADTHPSNKVTPFVFDDITP